MTTLPPRQLSRELRLERSPDLKRRRQVIGLSMVGVAAGAVVGLYQTGILKHLPDPPSGGLFDSDRVDASEYAYKRLQTPDAFGMIVTYGVTAALAAAGGKDRARQIPWLPLALVGKIASDVVTNVALAREEWAYNKALCAYCQAASVASAVSLAVALPEAAKAVRHLTAREA